MLLGFDVPEDFFPLAPALDRVLGWWNARPAAQSEWAAALEEFFGDRDRAPDPADDERMPEWVRFIEWLLLDRPLAESEESPAAIYAREAQGAKREGLVALLGARHDVWRVLDVAGEQVGLRPLGGGSDLLVEHAGLAADAQVGEAMVGRFFPWQGGWLPSLALFFIADPGLEPGSVPPVSAYLAQELFFSSLGDEALDPEAARAELARLLGVFDLGLDLDALAALALESDAATTFLQAVMARAEERLAEQVLASQLKDWRSVGPLLANFWQHLPRPALGGRSHADLALEADTRERAELAQAVDRVFEAIAAEDAAAIEPLLDPDGELALVFDLWGWPGLRLLTDWGAPSAPRELLGVEEDMGAIATEVAWQHAEARRGATLWFLEGPTGYRLTEAVAELGTEELVNPAYARAQDKGLALPWRTETDDAVERKLRNSLAARQLPLLDQATMIKAWRMVSPALARDVGAPEAWAAAVEAYFRHSLGQDLGPNQVAEFYGAKRTLVKERFAAIEQQLNQAPDTARA